MAAIWNDQDARDAFDRHVLQSAFEGRFGEMLVPGVLDALAEAHGVEDWTPAAFEHVFVQGAMRAWHGELDVERRADRLVVRTRTCPLASLAAEDPSACASCRALQAVAAQESFGWRLRGIAFPKLLTQGDDRCEAHVVTAGEP